MSAPVASVVVPTRDRPSQLALCLAALAAQTRSDFEVIVVDDASTEPQAVKEVVEAHGARLVHAGGHGPARARNLGVTSSRASFVAFTDDDCRPEPGWLDALARRFEQGARIVAGATHNGRPDDTLATASQLITNYLTESSLDRGAVGFAPTCNLATTRAVIAEFPFDERFGLPAGEDREWCSRLVRHGFELAFEPGAVVSHHPDLSFGSFWRQQFRYGRGALMWRRRTPGAGRQDRSFYTGLLAAGWREGPVVAGLVSLAQVATAAGLVAEAMATRRQRATP